MADEKNKRESEAFLMNHKEQNGNNNWNDAGRNAPFVAVKDFENDDEEKGSHRLSTNEEGTEQRHQWAHKAEYILSLMGYCVGLGNIWRFPYICIRNGGGAFLIPFFMCLFVLGLPLYFLENAMGQFVAKSTYHVWAICPLFKGVGISMITLTTLSSWYYVMVLGWTLIFLFNSFKSPLPWTRCDQPWNSIGCVPPGGLQTTDNSTSTYGMNKTETVTSIFDSMTVNGQSQNRTVMNGNWTMINGTGSNVTVKSSSEEFWINNVLELSPGLEHMDGLPWHTSVALVIASFIVFACIWKGVRSVGKVVYVTATLPYILILVLLIKGATLDGASTGIIFYIKPDFSKLLTITTWIEACVQVFYSLGAAWGNLVTVASYNKFHSNCMIDSIVLTLVCEGTSIFAGIATFSFLGHMSHTLQTPVANFSSSGPGLAFVVFPEAISYLPLPQLWGVIFFIMLFTLGLDSQFVCLETVFTFISDMWPDFMKRHSFKMKASLSLILCLAGLSFSARGGMYIFQLVDWYVGAFTVMICAILECVVVGWIYGSERFSRDIQLMIGRRPLSIFPFLWKYVTPWVLSIVCIVILIYYKAPVYEGYTYGPGGVAIGWCIATVPFLPIPAWAIYTLLTEKGTFSQRLKKSCTATDEWIPNEPRLVEQYMLDKKTFGTSPCPLPCTSKRGKHGFV